MISLRSTIAAALLTVPFASALSAQIVVQGVPANTPPAKAEAAVQKGETQNSEAGKGKPTIDEKAKAIYDKGVAAARALKTIDLCTQTKIDLDLIDPSILPPGLGAKSRVRIEFVDNAAVEFALGGKVVIERLDDGKVVERFIAGKADAILVMPEAKTFAQGASPMELMGVVAMAMPQWILEQRASGKPNREEGGMVIPESTLLSAQLAGTETIDEIECDVVKTVRELDMSSVIGEGELPEGMPAKFKVQETIAFARTDGLPRQMSMMPVMPEMGEMGEEGGMTMMAGPRTTWTAVTANAALAAELFSTTPPEGFTKVDPPENVVAGFAIGGDEGAARPEPELSVKIGDAAPDFALKDLTGAEVTLASLKGKVVLLDFWATWCGPCKAAMPTIQKLHDEYAAKGVAVLGVNTWEQNQKAAKDFIANKKYTYPCLMDGDKLAEAYGVPGIPTLVVIGKDGKVALIEVGLADNTGGGLRKAIDEALAK